jgi:hypothetical protein
MIFADVVDPFILASRAARDDENLRVLGGLHQI